MEKNPSLTTSKLISQSFGTWETLPTCKNVWTPVAHIFFPHAVSSVARCDFLPRFFFLAPMHAVQGKYWGAAWYCGDGRLLLPGLLMAGCCCIVADGKAWCETCYWPQWRSSEQNVGGPIFHWIRTYAGGGKFSLSTYNNFFHLKIKYHSHFPIGQMLLTLIKYI
jgi:hypothetical protein